MTLHVQQFLLGEWEDTPFSIPATEDNLQTPLDAAAKSAREHTAVTGRKTRVIKRIEEVLLSSPGILVTGQHEGEYPSILALHRALSHSFEAPSITELQAAFDSSLKTGEPTKVTFDTNLGTDDVYRVEFFISLAQHKP